MSSSNTLQSEYQLIQLSIKEKYSLSHPLKAYFAMVKKEFITLLRYPVELIGTFLFIGLIVSIFILAVQSFVPPDSNKMIESSSIVLYGLILYGMTVDGLWDMGLSISEERRMGTLESLYLSPVNKFMNLYGRITITMFLSTLISLFCVSIAWFIVGGLIINNVAYALLVILLFSMMVFGCGLFFAGVTLKLRELASVVSSLGQFLVIIFSSMLTPFSALPSFLLPICYALPFSYAVDLFRSLLIGTETELLPIFWEWIVVVTLAFITPILGYRYYLRCEKKVLKDGTLSQY